MLIARRFWIIFIIVLVGCTQQIPKKLASETNIIEELKPWYRLLADDPINPDAHFHIADYHFKQFISGGKNTDKILAIHHAQSVLKAKPNDFASQTLLYGIYYNAVRKGEASEFKYLAALFKEIPPVLRRGFYPPSLAVYLHQLELPQKDKVKEQMLLLDALREQPRNGLLHVQLSRYFFEQQAIDLGFASLLQGLRVEPNNSEILLAVGDAYKSRAYHFDCVYDHLDDIKQSTHYYKQVLGQKPDVAEAHFGLMVNYAHLGLAPLSLREGDIWLKQKETAENKWMLAVFSSYLGQSQQAEALFQQAIASQENKIINRGYIEHLMLQAKWQEAAKAFPGYIQSVKQPHVIDLIVATIIRAELDNENLKLDDIWKTSAKAVYFSPWDEALAKFWGDSINEDELKRAVMNSCQAADYELFVGYYKLLHNQVGEAKEYFERATKFVQPLNFERKLAETLLHNF